MHHEFLVKTSVRSFFQWIRTAFWHDYPRLILWWPVIFGSGVLGYFSLPEQPSTEYITVTFVIALVFVVIKRSPYLRLISLGIFAFSAVFFVAHLRTTMLGTVMIDQPIRHFSFTAIVTDVTYTGRGARLLLHLKDPPKGYESIKNIRLSLKPTLDALDIGIEIRGQAHLLPFGGPVSESGYQFRRTAYFQGLSATGQLLNYHEISPAKRQQIGLVLKEIRKRITDRIRAQFYSSQDVGGIMTALVTGGRGEISNTTRQAFTDAGLAHLLAISGLHLSLVAGFIFLLIRRGLALSIYLAESWDLKKVAALLTILPLFFYLVISGVGIPALRAFLMIVTAMVAILLDRNPLSMPLVCFAASVILLIYPESILSASFQLSFAAVIALIGIYENGWRLFQGWVQKKGIGRKIILYIAGVMITTLIASYATMPLTIAIFQRFSLQGILGNLVAVPMTGFVIMPLIVVFLLLMPMGLDFLVVPLLKLAIQILIHVSHSVASLPGAAIILPEQPTSFLVLFVIGGLWFCLWQQHWRYLGWGPMLLAFGCLRWATDPVIIIPDKGQIIYGFDGQNAFSMGHGWSGFGEEMFLRQVGRQAMTQLAQETTFLTVGGVKLFLTVEKLPKQTLQSACQWVDYLLSPRSLWYACAENEKKKVIDRFNVRHHGTVIARFTKGKAKITTSCQLQGCRPWSEGRCCF